MTYAVIGGSGLYHLTGATVTNKHELNTPFGTPSDTITEVHIQDHSVFFLPRHGANHHVPPHKINYLANVYALKLLQVDTIIAVNAVGGIASNLAVGSLVCPDQIIDYTYGREHTFNNGDDNPVTQGKVEHVDFTHPFDTTLRQSITSAAQNASEPMHSTGVYGCTQGPRLESAAEVKRLAQDGCTLVGMTVMPEAALAKELELAYASICLVANRAAGLSDTPLTIKDIHSNMKNGIDKVQRIIRQTILNGSAV